MLQVTKSITIRQPREEVYRFWRDFSHLPSFMTHVRSVVVSDDRLSHWVVSAPAGYTVEWDAEIVIDTPGELIAWRTLDTSDVRHGGTVRFEQAPGDRGTEVHVDLRYEAPAGKAGVFIASLLGEEPTQQLQDDLRRFKQVMETGEVVRSDGSLEGAGQGLSKQRPAQAPDAEVRS
jgi:uncharacterized membrane protein